MGPEWQSMPGGPDGQQIALFWKIAVGGESYAFTAATNQFAIAIIQAFSGRRTELPRMSWAYSLQPAAMSTPAVWAMAGITAEAGDDLVYFIATDQLGSNDTWTFSTPPGWTENQDDTNLAWTSMASGVQENVSAGWCGELPFVITRSAGGPSLNTGALGVVMALSPSSKADPPAGAYLRNATTNTVITGTTFTSQKIQSQSGSTFIIADHHPSSAATNTPTDSNGNTYTQVGTNLSDTNAGIMTVWKSENGVGGANHTCTVTYNATTSAEVAFMEVGNVLRTGSLDTGSRVEGNDTASPATVTSNTLEQANELVICCIAEGAGGGAPYFVESTGFAIGVYGQDGTTAKPITVATRKVSETTALTPSFTHTGATFNCALQIFGMKSQQAPDTGRGAIAMTGQPPSVSVAGAQFEAPDADITTQRVAWVPLTGANFAAMIDEFPSDDADYDWCAVPGTHAFEVTTQNATDPVSSVGHLIRYRLLLDSGTITVSLKQGATEIASWTHTGIAAATTQTYLQTLNATQTDSITDYTDLRLSFSIAN